MTDGGDDLARLPKLAGERGIERVRRKVNDGPVPANVEDSVVFGHVYVFERDRGCQFVHNSLFLKELLRFIVCERLH